MKTYEIKMKPTKLFNDLFKIRIVDESENFEEGFEKDSFIIDYSESSKQKFEENDSDSKKT